MKPIKVSNDVSESIENYWRLAGKTLSNEAEYGR